MTTLKLNTPFVLTALLAVLCFTPEYLGLSVISPESRIHQAAENSFLVDASFLSGLAVCFPLFLDTAIDLTFSQSDYFANERLLIICSLLIPNCIFFHAKAIHFSKLGQLCVCLFTAQRVCITTPLFSILSQSKTGVFSPLRVHAVNFLFTGSFMLLQYADIPGTTGQLFLMLSIAALLLSFVISLWVVYLYWSAIVSSDALQPSEYPTIILICTFFAAGLSNIIVTPFLTSNPFLMAGFGPSMIAFINLQPIVFATISILIPGRLARARIEEKDSLLLARQSFVNYISHEIRTPLNVSSIGLSLLEDSLAEVGVFVGENKHLVAQVKQSVQLATEILNELLTYEKLSSNLMVLEKTLENPIELVNSCLSIFFVQAEASGVKLTVDTSGIVSNQLDTIRFEVDKFKMAQVLRNLVSNALKFTPREGSITVLLETFASDGHRNTSTKSIVSQAPILSLECGCNPCPCSEQSLEDRYSSAATTYDWLRVTVQDTGFGIEAHNLPKVFREVVQFRANEQQSGKGTGLGLYISRGIVELHGGVVSVSSEGLGKGSTFCIEMPLVMDFNAYNMTLAKGTSGRLQLPLSSARSDKGRLQLPLSSARSDNGRLQLPLYSATSNNGIMGSMMTLQSAIHSNRVFPFDDTPSHHSKSQSRSLSPSQSLHNHQHQQLQQQLDSVVPTTESEFSGLRVPDTESCPAAVSSEINRPLAGLSILVVDDSAVSRKMVVMLLRRAGAQCLESENGKAGLDLVIEFVQGNSPYRIDMVLMDSTMPVMDGQTACRRMREVGFTSPIFGLTGHTLTEDVRSFIESGATHVFGKPINVAEFTDHLSHHLQLK